MEEEWRDIKGWEGHYMASSLGNIKSLDKTVGAKHNYTREIKGKIVKPCMGTNGYLYVGLCRNSVSKNHSVHSLIATSFLLNPLGKLQINHKDGVKTNNIVSNLEFVTQSENMQHSYNIGTHRAPYSMLGKFGKDHHLSKPIWQFSLNGEFIKEYEGVADACRHNKGFATGNVSAAALGKCKQAYGYVWKYEYNNLKQVG